MQYLPIIISIASLLLAAYSFLSTDSRRNTTELTTVIVKLENISSGIKDIKGEIAHMKDDMKDDHDKLIQVETSLSSAWKKINSMYDFCITRGDDGK